MKKAAINCDCCGEEPATDESIANHHQPLCAACQLTLCCPDCGRETLEERILVWANTSKCARCEALDECERSKGQAIERLEQIAEEHGYRCRLSSVASTGTLYYTLNKGERDVIVRLADHPTAHCTEQISIVFDGRPGPDDHTFEDLRRVLSKG